MAFANKKGITVASGFKLQAEAPIDARFTVTSKTDLDELVTLHAAYKGLEVYCEADGEYYSYNGMAWVSRTTASGAVIPSGGTAGQVLKKQSDGSLAWQADNNTTYNPATQSESGLMSGTDKKKLDGIAAGAQVNTIEHVQINGKEVTPTNKTVNLAVAVAADLEALKTELSGKITAIPKFAISVVSALPTSGISETTVYLVKSGDETQNLYTEYVYVGGKWEKLGAQTADLSGYVTKSDAVTGVTGSGMKVTFTRGDGKTFDVTLTQVQPDWNATSGAGAIKNKPTALPANGGDADTVGGHKVLSDVPANAKFTDTTYGKATAAADGLMSKEDKAKLDSQPEIYFGAALPSSAPAGSICFITG